MESGIPVKAAEIVLPIAKVSFWQVLFFKNKQPTGIVYFFEMFMRLQIKLTECKIDFDSFGSGKGVKYFNFFLIVVDRILCTIKDDLVKANHAG